MPPMTAEYHRAWRKRSQHLREKERERHAERYKNPEERYKRRARKLVQNAILSGSLVPEPCEVCGVKAEAHHDDYSKPLAVRWLCPLHHRQHHHTENCGSRSAQ